MKHTIADLWNGDIAPWENCGMDNQELKELIQLMRRNREELRRELNEKQMEVLEKYIGNSEEYVYRMTEQSFCDGFCLAAKLITEALA